MEKSRAPRNQTITLSTEDQVRLRSKLVSTSNVNDMHSILDRTINGDARKVIRNMPPGSVDLVIIDPPYNLNKDFKSGKFKRKSISQYTTWVSSWVDLIPRILKPNASVYICCDWRSSVSVFDAASKHLTPINRITWEREKGRGAKSNWKNCSEDIWFFVNGINYTFNVDAVKLKRRVIAPYKNNGMPKGWKEEGDGNFRFTSPSNLWTDISIPFWSMPENTDHPTQKPEKLIAKLVLASSREGDIVFDPFLGSGTTSVVCKKLYRHYIGVELDPEYCLLAEKRLEMAAFDSSIQGYQDGVFWERNTLALQMQQTKKIKSPHRRD